MKRKILDENGRLFGKVSVIDVIVLIAVVVLAIAAFTKFNLPDSPVSSDRTVDVVYTIQVNAMRDLEGGLTRLLRAGDKLYFRRTGAFIGTIVDVRISDAMSLESLEDGTYILARVYDRYDVELVVEAKCTYSNGRYYADRTFELHANEESHVYTKYVDIAFARVADITIK
jgi:hypothetical protein